MSGRNPTKRSEERGCERCGNPPPTWKKQMAKGEKVRWLCARCVHASMVARAEGVDYAVLDKPTCSACGKEFGSLDRRWPDRNLMGDLRGVVCADCRALIRASGNQPARLVRMMVYMNLPPQFAWLKQLGTLPIGRKVDKGNDDRG
jgi:hypothetical protein